MRNQQRLLPGCVRDAQSQDDIVRCAIGQTSLQFGPGAELQELIQLLELGQVRKQGMIAFLVSNRKSGERTRTE